MRQLTLTLFILFCTTSLFSQLKYSKVNWVSIEEAQELQQQKYKPILVDFYAIWSDPSWLLAVSFEHPHVVEYVNKNFYPVRFNSESGGDVRFRGKRFENPDYVPKDGFRAKNSVHEFCKALGVNSFPRVLIFDKQLDVSKKIDGYRSPGDLFSHLRKASKL